MPKPTCDAWEVSETEFPSAGQATEKLRLLLRYAVLAPSGHNTQPWFFKIVNGSVELYAERARALPVVDPEDRELIISCGAALLNLRIAMRHFGYVGKISTFPCPAAADLLAAVRLGNKWEATAEEHLLFQAIPKRHTNRTPFEDRQVPPLLLSELQVAAAEEGAWFHIVQGEESRNTLGNLVAEGDRIQMSDTGFRRELAARIHPNRGDSCDGIPGYAFGLGDWKSYLGPLMVRTFDLGKGQAAKDRELAVGSPILAVLGTEIDAPPAWLSAGQALERVLLYACAKGIHASFLNQPIEVAALRPRLRDATGRTGFPQLVLRMGYGKEVKPAPRRMINEVVC